MMPPGVQDYWHAVALATLNVPFPMAIDPAIRVWPKSDASVICGSDDFFLYIPWPSRPRPPRWCKDLLDSPALARLALIDSLSDLAKAQRREPALRRVVSTAPAHVPAPDTVVVRVYFATQAADTVYDVLVELYAFGTAFSQTAMRYYPARRRWLAPYLWTRGVPYQWRWWPS
jgi:hypothetical protein